MDEAAFETDEERDLWSTFLSVKKRIHPGIVNVSYVWWDIIVLANGIVYMEDNLCFSNLVYCSQIIRVGVFFLYGSWIL